MIPPIVGVPAFSWWPAGPSCADVLAELPVAQERDELRREEDADEQRGGARDQDLCPRLALPGHRLRPPAPRRTASRPTPREPLTSTVSPARASSGSIDAASAASATAWPSPSIGVEHAAASGPTVSRRSTSALARVRADLGVERPLLRPQFEHVAEHGDAAPGSGHGQLVESGPHRHRIGVVAVVDDGDAVREVDPFAAQRPRSGTSTRPVRPHAHGQRRGHGRQRVEPVVGLGVGQLELDPLPAASIATRSPSASASARRRLPRTLRPRGRRADAAPAAARRPGRRRPARAACRGSAPPWPRRPPPACPAARGGPGPMLTMTPTSGSAISVELGDLPGAAHRHLEHERLGPAGRSGRRAAARSRC